MQPQPVQCAVPLASRKTKLSSQPPLNSTALPPDFANDVVGKVYPSFSVAGVGGDYAVDRDLANPVVLAGT